MQLWAYPEPWPTLYSPDCFAQLEPGALYWLTLEEVVAPLGDAGQAILRAAATKFAGPIRAVVAALGLWPVVYEVGSNTAMRWIRSTFRGSLGGSVEQFQHKIDWGIPGADPDPDEAAQLVIAGQLRTAWGAAFAAAAPNGLNTRFSASVKYLEVGVVKMTATEATEADGTGGNVAQANDTVWSAWAGTTGPAGTSAGLSLPFEVSCAVTLATDHRGPSGRGRFYLPPFAVGIMDAHGRFNVSELNTIGGQIGNFLVAAQTSTGLQPVVVSPRRLILNRVRRVEMGAVPDSQRRRRRSQQELRTVAWTQA